MNAIAKRILRQRRRAAGLDGLDEGLLDDPGPRVEWDSRRRGPIAGKLSPIDEEEV